MGNRGEVQRAHEVFSECISVLVHRSTFRPSRFRISVAFMVDLIEKNVTGDVFAIEHASILYNICWFSLKSLRYYRYTITYLCFKPTKFSFSVCFLRNDGCEMSVMPLTTIVSGLKLSFILCREVPLLFQKVS